MVLRATEHRKAASVAQHMKGKLFALEAFLHDDGAPRLAEGIPRQHRVDRSEGFGCVLTYRHALARREPAGLDHDGPVVRANPRARGPGVREHLVGSRWNSMATHEVLRVRLGTLELGGLASGAEAGDVACREQVRKAEHERRFRPDHDEFDRLALGESDERRHIVGGDRDALRDRRDARIARRTE